MSRGWMNVTHVVDCVICVNKQALCTISALTGPPNKPPMPTVVTKVNQKRTSDTTYCMWSER